MIGLDGCKGGWVACEITKTKLCLHYIEDLFQFFNHHPPTTLVVDMPFILPVSIDGYPRDCDISAKKRLGKAHSSIFYAPLETWLDKDLACINQICEEFQKPKLSVQSFNLFKSIQSIQKLKSLPHIACRESHPELFFKWFSNSTLASKKSEQGILDRLSIISNIMHELDLTLNLNDMLRFFSENKQQLSFDDILDAIAMALCCYFETSTVENLNYQPHLFNY